jgi:hypothetical protein
MLTKLVPLKLKRLLKNLHLGPVAKKCLKLAAVDIVIMSFLNPMYFAAGILWDRGDWLIFPCLAIIIFLNGVTIGLSWYVTYLILVSGNGK